MSSTKRIVQLIILVCLTGITWARPSEDESDIPDSLAMENSPYISHVKPPQSYPWFSQRKPSYGNRETPISSRLTDGRNHQETNVSLDKRGYYSSDLKNEKSSQGSAPAAERQQNKWREVPLLPRNYFPQMFNKNPSYFGQGQRRLAL